MPKNKSEQHSNAAMRFLSVPWFRWGIILLALALAGVSVFYTLAHLTISTSRKDLIAGNQRLILLSDHLSQAFGDRDGLVVVVENAHRSQSVRFAEALATELRRYPDRFTDLFYRLNPDNFKPWALLYPEIPDLLKLKDNLSGQKSLLAGLAAQPRLATFYGLVNGQIAQAMIGHVFTGFLEEGKKKALPDVSLLNATLRQLELSLEGNHPYRSPFEAFFPGGISDLSEEGYFFTDNVFFHSHFDLNPLHLQNPRVESVVWENRLMKESKYSTSFGAMTADSLKDLEAKTAALKKLPTVSHVESALSFLPAHVEEKRRILKEIQPLLTSIRFPKPRRGSPKPRIWPES
ncbi:MAG: hypothetical protein ACYC6G_00250 [Desulfobaccales bacterium]